jgi:hypothetical protein
MTHDSQQAKLIEECLLDRVQISRTIEEMMAKASDLGAPIASRHANDSIVLFIASLEQAIREIDAIVASHGKLAADGKGLLLTRSQQEEGRRLSTRDRNACSGQSRAQRSED